MTMSDGASNTGSRGSSQQPNNSSINSSELFRSVLVGDRNLSRGYMSVSSEKNRVHRPATMQSSRAAQVYEELNTLKFASLGLYGREAELQRLEKCFHQLDEDHDGDGDDHLNLVVVSGASGAGKTAIVKEFSVRIAKKDQHVMFASGKYDQYLSVPYGAFVAAFSQLCSDIRSHPLFDSKIQEAILKAVGDDYKLLLDLIPNIGELVFEATEGSSFRNSNSKLSSTPAEEYDIVKSKEKFKFLMRRFLHAICQPEHKVVLFLDDIQWIDSASLRLLEMILSDTSTGTSLLIVATCRDDELNETHQVSKLIQRIQQKRTTASSLTTVSVQNLPLPTVESFLSDLLNRDQADVRELAEISYTRVDGNMFFLIQFITALRDGGFLQYNIGAMKWTWDGGKIRRSTVVATNVLDVLMNKMERLPEDAKIMLQVVACLGASFDQDLVTLVLNSLKTKGRLLIEADTAKGETEQPLEAINSVDTTEVLTKRTPQDVLQLLEGEGLLENFGNYGGLSSCPVYCFSHSQIGLAAHELMDDESMSRLKLQMGQILYENRSDIDYQSRVFTVVDLWNDGSDLINGSKQIRILLELNFEAGKKALESFAFGASCFYLQKAIDCIPEHKRWEEEYDLSLALYNCLIKAEHSNGTWDPLRLHATEVIKTQGPVLDKIVAYTSMIRVSSTIEHCHKDSIALSVHVLKLLNVPFSLKLGKLAVVGALIKTKILLSKVPLEMLLTQKEMTDEVKHVALDILSTVNSSMYASNPELLMVSVLKTLRWSLKYGVTRDTAKCVSFYGLVEMALGNQEYATKACNLAVELAEKRNLMDTEYSPTSAVYGFVLPWTSPLHICSNRLLAGYNVGLETGDLHYGFMNATLFVFFCYCTGKPFESLEVDYREFARQMKEYNQALQLQFLSLTWQTILNLMGRSDGNPVVLTGEAMDFEEMLAVADHDKIPPLRAQIQCHRLQLAVYYQDFDLAAKLIGPASKIALVNPGNPIIWRNALFEGVAAFELVRRGQKRWRSTAIKALKRTQKWVDTGNVNCVHILYLLQAEKAAMENDAANARALFDKAIVTAARNGFRNDRALASERASMMYAELGDEFWFNDYFRKAKDAYEEMEAFGKVDEMSERSRRKEFEISVVNQKASFEVAGSGGPEESFAFSDLTSLPTRATGESDEREWSSGALMIR